MAVRRRDIDRQRDAVFLDSDLDFDATDLLAAINAALKTACNRGFVGAEIVHHDDISLPSRWHQKLLNRPVVKIPSHADLGRK
jgi:hypothetical protein